MLSNTPPAKVRQAKTRVRPAPALDRKLIISEALAVLDRDGLSGLTTRSLAAALGVQGPALYYHFPNKRSLLQAMAEDLIQPAISGKSHSASWQDSIRSSMSAIRSSILSHQDGALLIATAKIDDLPRTAIFAELGSPLVEAGATPHEATKMIAALCAFVLGSTSYEQMQGDIALANDNVKAREVFDYGLDGLIAGFVTMCPALAAVDSAGDRKGNGPRTRRGRG